MPDPVSISVAVVSLVTSATKAAKTCNTLCDKYKDAPFSLTSVHIECLTTKASLSMVDMLMKRNPSLMKSRLEADTPLAENIDVVLTGCCLTFALAEIEINKLTAIDKDSVIRSWKDKCRAVWQEDRMVMLLDRMRGIRDAVNLLLTVLQTESLGRIHQLLETGRPTVQSIRDDIDSVHSHRRESAIDSVRCSIFLSDDGETEFSFDDEIVNAKAYRRVYNNLRCNKTTPADRTSTMICTHAGEPSTDLSVTPIYAPFGVPTAIANRADVTQWDQWISPEMEAYIFSSHVEDGTGLYPSKSVEIPTSTWAWAECNYNRLAPTRHAGFIRLRRGDYILILKELDNGWLKAITNNGGREHVQVWLPSEDCQTVRSDQDIHDLNRNYAHGGWGLGYKHAS